MTRESECPKWPVTFIVTKLSVVARGLEDTNNTQTTNLILAISQTNQRRIDKMNEKDNHTISTILPLKT